MRTTTILIFLCLLPGGLYSQTNRVTVADAVKVASGLRVGMREDDADEYLFDHGINCRTYDTNGAVLIYYSSVGDNFRWTTCYPLRAAFNLDLDYSNAYTTTNWYEWNGILEDAKIESNEMDIISITFTNSK